MKKLAQVAFALFGIRLSSTQLHALEEYEELLLEWNTRINLTAIHEPEQIRTKHFLDSFSCYCVMRDSPMETVIDLGTGAGFPGIPLKILNPSMHLTLVDSVKKKVDFCRRVIDRLKLEDVQIIQERAEVLGQTIAYREKFNWALARAVAVMPVLTEYLLPLVRVGGAMLAMKGETAHAEVVSSEHAIRVLGGHFRKILPITLPGIADDRYLVVVDKIAATPQTYPRRPGIPIKRPL